MLLLLFQLNLNPFSSTTSWCNYYHYIMMVSYIDQSALSTWVTEDVTLPPYISRVGTISSAIAVLFFSLLIWIQSLSSFSYHIVVIDTVVSFSLSLSFHHADCDWCQYCYFYWITLHVFGINIVIFMESHYT